MLNHGWLPRIYEAERSGRLLDAYVGDYLQQEVAAEGLVRNIPAFSGVLAAAALSDAEIVNLTNIARECGVSVQTVKNYFEIIVDTLLGSWLPAYTKRPKRRVIQAPKFYFGDVGVVNQLAQRGTLQRGGELFGKAFENWVHHELRSVRLRDGVQPRLSYWRLASGIEVDFLFDDLSLAVEAKATGTITDRDLRGLRQLMVDQPEVRARAVVSLERRRRLTSDGIVILPADELAAFLADSLPPA